MSDNYTNALARFLQTEKQQLPTNGKSMWGYERTSPDDMFWYLPKEMVGDTLYRNQGVMLHGGLALSPIGSAARLANALYALGSVAAGRTAPTDGARTTHKSGPEYFWPPSAMLGAGGKVRRGGNEEGEISKTPWTYPDSDQNMAYSFTGRPKDIIDGKWKRWK